MWWDADIDALMARTRLRPIPAGLIEPREALFFGLTLSLIAVLTLALAANLARRRRCSPSPFSSTW